MAEGKNLVGVAIGSSSIKVCQLRELRKGYSLAKVAYQDLAPQTVVDGHVMNAGVVVEALNKMFHDNKIKQREIALGVSGQSVIIRKITVPLMTPAELDEQIQWEAEQHIPFDIKDVHVDYEVLRKKPETGQMDLLLVAAKRDEINDYANIAREAKLKPVVIDIDAFTVQNMFEVSRGGLPQDQIIAIINVGASLSSLNVISVGASAFTRDIASGGNTITEEIQKQLGVPYEQAEAYKSASDEGGMVPKQVIDVVSTVSDTIASEIQRSLDFYLATSGEGELSRVFLTGGTANLPQLVTAIERRSRVPVEVFFPTERMTVEPKDVNPQLVQAKSAQLSVALGLALRKDKEKRA
jgi:type IV pilus assembly protein PilM